MGNARLQSTIHRQLWGTNKPHIVLRNTELEKNQAIEYMDSTWLQRTNNVQH